MKVVSLLSRLKKTEAASLSEGHADMSAFAIRRNRLLLTLFDLLLLAPIVLYISLYQLNLPSLHHVDESTHARAVQEMVKTGDYWQPRVFGIPYYNKPPFKMWVSAIPLSLFGETNFNFRIIDALCGIATVLLVYLFGSVVLESRLTGAVAALSLISSRFYVLVHGIRTGTQDSMLILLVTIATLMGWKFLRALREDDRRILYVLGLAGGVVIGCALLTKNVAGLMPYMVIGTYLFLSGEYRLVLSRGKGALFLLVAISLILPALYVVPHCVHDAAACKVMLGQEVVNRATHGYHNIDNPMFYLIRLFRDRAAIPMELLLPGLAFALYLGMKHGERRMLFLLAWCVVPVAFYSAIPSRLTWYMAPAYPAMALLAGVVVSEAIEFLKKQFRPWWNGKAAFPGATVPVLFLLSYGMWGLEHNLHFTMRKVSFRKPQIAIDKATEEIMQLSARGTSYATIAYQLPMLARNEMIYRDRLPKLTRVSTAAELRTALDTLRPGFVLTSRSAFPEVVRLKPIQGYVFLPPTTIRQYWAVLISYVDMPLPSSFTRVKRFLDIGDANIPVLHGFTSAQHFGDLTVRKSKGPQSSFVISGDWAMWVLGTATRVNLAYQPTDGARDLLIGVYLNNDRVAEFHAAAHKLDTYEFSIPPERWLTGENVLSFRYENPAVSRDAQIIMYNWVETELKQ